MRTVITTLILVAATAASALEVTTPRKTYLLPTRITRVTVFSPIGITVQWIPIRNDREPVIGYKVNLRAFEGTLTNKIETVNGTEVFLVDKIAMPELRDVTLASPHKLHQYDINNANQTELTIHGIKKGTPYVVEVLAYSDMGDGPTSPVLGFQIRKDRDVTFFGRNSVVMVNKLSLSDAK